MQRTNIFIVSASEMHHERLKIVDLLRDIEYMQRLRKSENCIVMFWRSLEEYTEKELRLALEEQSKGNYPQRTHIIFTPKRA